mmetsp:Transcript_4664/g.8868  ORF Transcript_4664/g.8868 Transcript_4664/m.8868 type:complete len:325 (-) Transcript_4664:125-1099(-)
MVPLQLPVHGLDLVLHVPDLGLPRLDLPLQLLDLVVQHKLELLQLLVLLLQLVDALLALPNRAVPLPDLSLQALHFRFQLPNRRAHLVAPLPTRFQFVLLLLDGLLQHRELLLHDPVLALEPQRELSLRAQLHVEAVPHVFHFAVHVVLQLQLLLLELPRLLPLLPRHLPLQRLVLLQLGLEVVGDLPRVPRVRADRGAALLLPPLHLGVSLCDEALVLVHLFHDGVLVPRLLLLQRPQVRFVNLPQPLLVLHRHVVLFFFEQLVLVLLLLHVLRELLKHFFHLLTLRHVPQPELVLVVQLKLLDLGAQFHDLLLPLGQVGLGD